MAPVTRTSGDERAVAEAAARRRPVGAGVADGSGDGVGEPVAPRGRAEIEPPGARTPDTAAVRAAIEFMEAFPKTHDLGDESIGHWIREGRR